MGKASPDRRKILQHTIEVLKKSGNGPDAAVQLGVSLRAVHGRLAEAKSLGLVPRDFMSRRKEVSTPASRIEERDARFWRNRAAKLQKEASELEHVVEQLSGLHGVDQVVPAWAKPRDDGPRGRSVIGCLISDVHMGEVISAEAILGINAFDPDIAAARLRRYFEAACVVGGRWSADTECEGVLLALAGDLISGDIHEELRITNAMTSHDQVGAVVAVLVAGIRILLEAYPRVHVVSVPGNHGRTTFKPTAKLYAHLSYDILATRMLEQHFAGDDRVTWQYGKSTDQITPIFGRTILTTHGDKIGTRGGMGFAGPDLPIVRGSKKVREQQAAVGWTHDIVQFGHYHWTTNPANGRVLGNGSVPGYSEYAADLRAVAEPPQQWLYLLHSRWGLRERAPIQLEAPKQVARPRVRIPAAMERR
ncbi:hypothetical protein [uncultured Alsobacter sp.]|uniref:hypothetical protein n=1 Tax=uncultured Alsobacter sp. TaxID=1748258 RepID=UPI0025CC5591|nr:hypothetical protein [uncultured Alsobacter sp.]